MSRRENPRYEINNARQEALEPFLNPFNNSDPLHALQPPAFLSSQGARKLKPEQKFTSRYTVPKNWYEINVILDIISGWWF
jgi:hypothetical protein